MKTNQADLLQQFQSKRKELVLQNSTWRFRIVDLVHIDYWTQLWRWIKSKMQLIHQLLSSWNERYKSDPIQDQNLKPNNTEAILEILKRAKAQTIKDTFLILIMMRNQMKLKVCWTSINQLALIQIWEIRLNKSLIIASFKVLKNKDECFIKTTWTLTYQRDLETHQELEIAQVEKTNLQYLNLEDLLISIKQKSSVYLTEIIEVNTRFSFEKRLIREL